ncbi:thioesterase II family protein [Actinoalloteichus caeruleus]|nr:alpha/beta fold hydrolase [Actinoalloteichus caeruleus]
MTTRLYCLAHAGGDARMFRSWSAALAPEVEVRPVQLPGRGDRLRDPLVDDLTTVLDDVLSSVDTDVPYALFGHSLGAILAFEAAGRLRDAGLPGPRCLFVSGHRAPHLPLREAVIHHLPDDQFIERLRELNGTPPVVLESPAFLRVLLPVLRADFTISETYRYRDRPALDCPVVALGGKEDPDVDGTELAEWRRHTRGPCRRTMFPGGHFFLSSERDAVLAVVAAELGSVTSPQRSSP